MKANSILFTLACLWISFISNGQMANSNTTTPDSLLLAEFKQNTIVWMDAYNSKDASNLVPLYTIDARYVSGHVNGLVADGRQAVIAYLQQGMSGGGHIDSIEILDVEVSCDLATLFCKYHATNSGVEAIGRNLLVMKKINGTWLIVLHMTVV